MNKVKLIYDVVMNLKEKQKFAGVLKAEGTKEGKKILEANIGFEKDLNSGLLKSDVVINVDCDKKKFKHESKTEIMCNEMNCDNPHKNLFKHMHTAHHEYKLKESVCCYGKDKLSKLAFGLQILYNVKLEELSDDKVQLTLNLEDISEKLCGEIHSKIAKKCKDKHKDIFNKCCNLDKHNGNVEVIVNKDKEIEKVTLKVAGLKNNGKEDIVIAEFKGEVDLF